MLYGHVLPDGDGQFPLRVRALADSGVVCGTASVQSDGRVGTYAIRISTADTRPGCPASGDFVNLVLLYGLVDDGTPPASRVVIYNGLATPLDLARPSAAS